MASVRVAARRTSNRSTLAGGSAFFRVHALGSLPLNYQWYANGAAIAGAILTPLLGNHAGRGHTERNG